MAFRIGGSTNQGIADNIASFLFGCPSITQQTKRSYIGRIVVRALEEAERDVRAGIEFQAKIRANLPKQADEVYKRIKAGKTCFKIMAPNKLLRRTIRNAFWTALHNPHTFDHVTHILKLCQNPVFIASKDDWKGIGSTSFLSDEGTGGA